MGRARDSLKTFTLANLPELDVVVEGALELFAEEGTPAFKLDSKKRVLALGSGNALATARIVFNKQIAYFANESSYQAALAKYVDIDTVVVVSASGSKHAEVITKASVETGKPVVLLTNNPHAPAGSLLPPENVHVFPRNREPYTYNTSTYLGLILATTGENSASIHNHLVMVVEPRLLRNFEQFGAFTFIVPTRFAHLVPMVRTKFDELFGPMVSGRVFTEEEIKHAKTVIESPDECFIALGTPNDAYGIPRNRLFVPLPEEGGYGAALMTAYYIVGKIQRAHPPYFKQNIERYTQKVSSYFKQSISPIVE